MNRRQMMQTAAGLGLGVMLPNGLFAQSIKKLEFPPLLDATSSQKFRLRAQAGETQFAERAGTDTLGFNQGYLGPTLRLRTGFTTQAEVENTLDEPMSAHWHGLMVPGESDGGPHQPILPGQTWRPLLPLDQPPATAWYHSHVHGATARQVMYGLAGVLQVTDGRDDERGLPSNYGVDDLTLVLQDRQFDWRGRIKYTPGMHETMNGFLGDTILVNGQIDTAAEVPRGLVRCRLVNGSNSRIYNLWLSDGRPMHLVATDGGFIDQPLPLTKLTLAPGERYEALIDFTNGNDTVLMSDNVNNSPMGGMMGGSGGGAGFAVLPFRIDASLPVRITKMPLHLNSDIPDLIGADATVRRISLDMSMGMGMMMSRSGQQFSINGETFDQKRLNFTVAQNSVERWVVSADMMMHPFHIHGVRFQVVSENGQTPRAQNDGWKDTVLIDGTAELLMQFEKPASATAPFMYHCHILEHEDGGMMGQFSVA
ncbi:multicopper oxidase domain-containing protein [Litoreibacter arenae]|uniref:Blue copper oxidase CueO n=1 Tax=Litoreibacter arenae DSM 19593 TaxID=1123360 RepID=S9QDB8_9RHOB|nr:multicopper oxidase domain-containing protein [Litoreibacter arenae]EPX77563.1 Blue copper oxidase CueO precursor [Litoreibacter arenae DSM 19593]